MLKGKIALITGSTSGLGWAIAQNLAKAGCDIVINGFRDQEKIKNLCKIIESYNVKVIYQGVDLKYAIQIKKMVADVLKNFESIDILVNNAGIQYVAPVEDFPLEKWNEIVATNLTAAFCTIKYILPIMKKNKWGRIINISSAHGLVASENKVAYVASKHGLLGITKVIALEAANTGVTCNAICPGWIETPLVTRQIAEISKKHSISEKDARREILTAKHPLKKFVSAEEIAKLILSVCSMDSMTGSCVSIDCGWTAQ